MKKLLCMALVMLLLCPMALASGLSVTDDMGRVIAFDKTPMTCVSLTPANTEILFALGLGDKVIGVDSQSDYPEAALAIENKLGDYYAPNIEAIVALAPDVVFASDKLQKDAIDQLESLGLKVVSNDPTNFDGIAPGIELVAQVMGADADPIIESLHAAKEDVKTKVYFALSFGEFGDYTAGPGTFIDQMITLCRGTNVAGDMPVSWPQYSMEQLIQDDPDLIIISDYMGDGSLELQLMQTPGYDALRCVKEGHVYGIDANIVSRPGPRIGEALRAISDLMDKASQATQPVA